MREKYYDKNGNEIQAGMILVHCSGDEELVYECGDENLGFLASGLRFLELHPDWPIEYYPLSQFNLSEWEIREGRICTICGANMVDGFTDLFGGYACSEKCLHAVLNKECGEGNWGISENEGENGGYYYNLKTGEDTGWFYTEWF